MQTKIKTIKQLRHNIPTIAQNSLWVIWTQIISGFFAFITTIVLSNTLSKEVFGEYRFYLSIIPMLIIFSLPGISVAIIQSVARNKKICLSHTALTRIKYGFIASFISAIISAYYFFIKNNINLATAFFLIAMSMPLFDSFSVALAYLKGKEKFNISFIYESTLVITLSLFLIIFSQLTENPIILLAIYILSHIIVHILFFKKYALKNKYTFNSEDTDKVIIFGKKLFPIDALGALGSSIDKILIWHLLGAQALAIYTVSLTIPLFINRAFSFIPQVLLPRLSRVNYSNKQDIYKILKRIALFFLLLLFIPLFYIPLSPYIFITVFKKYPEAIVSSQLMSIVIIFQIISAILWSMITANKNHKIMLIISLLHIIIPALFFISLKNLYGINAMILGFGVFQILSIIIIVINLILRIRSK